MRVILFGATGMVGQGVLRECLCDPEVREIVSVVRAPSGLSDPRVREVVHGDFLDYSAIEGSMSRLDACFYCLGVSSAGMSEKRYSRVTHDYAMAAAYTLLRLNPDMAFVFVSGHGADPTEQGRSMWARVKGRTENALLKLPFRAFMFRPALIRPLHGIRSRTRLYRWLYSVGGPLVGAVQRGWPGAVTTTEQIGRAMLRVARDGYPKPILETADINRLS